ncbi:pentapeptide repeat-containing protein [Microcoleus sp. F8_C2]
MKLLIIPKSACIKMQATLPLSTMSKDFSHKNLRGRNFKGQDLTGANFSHADIRSADFTNAVLIGANFSHAKAGLQHLWVIVLLIISLILSVLSGLLSVLAGLLVALFFTPIVMKDYTTIPGWLIVIVLAAFFIVTIRKGLRAVVVLWAMTVPMTAVVAIALATIVPRDTAATITILTPIIVAGIVATAVAVAAIVATAGAVTELAAVLVAATLTTVGVVFAVATLTAVGVVAAAARVAAPVAAAVVVLGIYIAWRTLAGDEKYAFVRTISVICAATGGTSFRDADLTDADFTQATLKSTNFIGATLTRTNWFHAKKLDRARVGDSILANPAVQDLLINREGRNKSFIRMNLKGAYLEQADLRGADFTDANLNQATLKKAYLDQVEHQPTKLVRANLRGADLIEANLSYANLKEADIVEATFQGANLEWTNLTLTQAIGTDFTNAQMTGACVEAWNIENSTKLDNVDCRFIYLLEQPREGTDDRERRPSSGEFKPGEFTKLFEEVLNTIDLIFNKEIDWKVFVAAFKKVQVENEGTELAIQSIENKGDGVVVVRVSVPPDTNKEKIHSEFTQNYQLALKELEKYKNFYEEERKKYSDMHEIVKLLANHSHVTQVNSISMSDSVQENNQYNLPDANRVSLTSESNPVQENNQYNLPDANEVSSTSESNFVQENNQYNLPDVTVAGSNIGTNHGIQIGTQFNYAVEQNLAKAAEDIDKLQFNTETTQIEEKTKHLERPKFSVVYPENISYDKWHSLYFFMYSQELSKIVKTKINKLTKITKIKRGWDYEKHSSIFSSVIPEGSLVEISWFSEEVKVNPEKISFNWFEDFQEFNFRIKYQKSKEINEKINLGLLDYVYLHIDISVNTLPVIFPITLAIGIGNTQDSKISTIDLGLIETIFASYSEADDEVVEDFKEKYEAIGISMFTEAIPYRNPGVRDQALQMQELFGIIESSDIFQLFWSSSAQQCEGVKRETAKAIELIQDGKKPNFFRGVYWEEQFPELPAEMVGMPFSKLPRLRAYRKEKAGLVNAIEREAARPIAITTTAIAESRSDSDSFDINQSHAVTPNAAIAKDQATQQFNLSSVTSEPQCTPEQILVQNLLRKLQQFIKPIVKKIGLIVKSLLNFR